MACFLAWDDEGCSCGGTWSRQRSCFVSTPFADRPVVSLLPLCAPVQIPRPVAFLRESSCFPPSPAQLPSVKSVPSVVENPRLLFKISPLRQESPVAVQFHFGSKRVRFDDSNGMKISVNITGIT